MPSNEYYNSLIDFTKDNHYAVNTTLTWEKYSFDISLDSLTNNFLNKSSPVLSSSHLTKKNCLLYSFELNTQVKLESLDYSIMWNLDSCWLSNNPCATNLSNTNDIIKFIEYNEYDESNYDAENNYEDYENVKLNERIDMLNTKFLRSARNTLETNTKLIFSSKTHFKFNSILKRYENYLNLTLNGYNLKKIQNRKYFFCNLKPCSVCECMSDRLETKVKKF